MRVVIAEDQVLLRDGLVRLLREAGHDVVGEVGDARRLVEAVELQRPDLVVADVRMPPTFTDDGARAVLFLRERLPSLAVVVLSGHVDPGLVATLTSGRVGSFGYLLKDAVLDTDAFLAQLEVVAGGGTVVDRAAIAGCVRREREALGSLTERELEVLTRVAAGRSNAGIAADLVVSRRTVDAHLRSIFTKLGITAAPDDNQRVLAVLSWFARREPVGR